MPIELSKYYSETPEEPTAFDLTSYYEPEEAPSFLDELSGALSAGYRNMKAGVAGTGYIVGAAERGEVAASFMDAIKNQPETPEYYTRFIDKAMKEGKDVTEAEGFWDTTIETLDLAGELMKEAISNPKGLAYGVVESGAQALPSIGLTVAGGIAGIPAGPLGIAGGMASGSALGTFAVEAGGHLKGLIVDKLRKEGKSLKDVTEQDIVSVMETEAFMSWAETESTKRGLAVGAVEGIFAAFGGKILAGAAGKSVFSKVGRGIADVGVETLGEAGGELAGQIVTEGPISPGEVGLEAIMGLGQSVATTATGAALRQIPGITPRPTDVPGEADIAPGAVPEEFRGDALDQELEATTRQGEALTGERDALDAAIVAEDAAVAGEPATFQQEVTDAMGLINSYPEFEDAVAGMQQQGALAPSIVKDLYDQALSIPHPQRTEGQKALVEMGRAAEARTASPIENLRAQPEDVVTEPLPEISEADKAAVVEAIPEELKGLADRAPAAPVTEVVEAPAAPVVEAPAAPVVEAPAAPVVEAPAAPVVEAPAAPVVEAPDAPVTEVVEAPAAPVTEVVEADSTTAAAVSNDLSNAVRDATVRTFVEPDGSRTEAFLDEFDAISGIDQLIFKAKKGTLTKDNLANNRVTSYVGMGELQGLKDAIDNGTIVGTLEQIKTNLEQVEAPAAPVTEAPVVEVKTEIDREAQEAQTSEISDLPAPSDAQIEAGNYKKGHVKVQGLDISVENPKGSTRSGTDPGGKPWSITMKDHYGYIKRTEGADGDQIDVFVGDDPTSEKVFVVDQIEPSTGKFDEHKVILGAKNVRQAKMFYNRNYARGWKGAGAVTEMSMDEFKTWVKSGDTKAPVSDQVPVKDVAPTAEPVRKVVPKEPAPVDAIKDTRGEGVQYHGTSFEIKGLQEGAYTSLNIYGQGLYTTDAMDIATGYSKKGRGKAPTIYKIEKLKTLNLYDMEQSIPSDVVQKLNDIEDDVLDNILQDPEIKNLREVYDEYRAEEFISADEIQGIFDAITFNLEEMGYDGLRHIGGLKTKNKAHNVEIFFHPETDIRISEVTEAPVSELKKPKAKKPVVQKPAPKKAATKVKHEVEKTPEVTTKKPVPIGKDIEVEPTPISRPSTAETHLRKGSIHDAIGHIRDNTDNPVYAEIIKKILPHIADNIAVEVISVDSTVPPHLYKELKRSRAMIDMNTETGEATIYIKDETFPGHGMREETIVHEALHAATAQLIEVGRQFGNAGTESGKSVQVLYGVQNKVMKYLNDRISAGKASKFEQEELTGIALSNVHEFVAWGLTNAEFQAYLKSIPFDKRNTLWSKFTKTIAKLLGFNATEHNAFVELLEATNSILDSDFRQEESLRKKMMSTSKTTPSFKHAKATMKKSFALAQLKTEQANLDYERSNRLDIKAGKKFKEIEAKVKILSQEIQDERAQDPYFDEGEGGVFDTVDRITAKPEQMQTVHERISQWVADHAFGWSDVRRFFGTKVTDIYAIERMVVEAYGKRLTAERSPTALSLVAKNAQVAASIATTKFGLKLIDNMMVIDHDQPGLEKILEPVAKLGNKYLRLWETWAVVKRAERLATEGREKFILDTEIQQIKDYVDARPNLKTLFEGTHAQYQTFNRSVLQLAIDAGWINEQDAFGGFRLVQGEGKDAKYIYQPNGTMFESAADAATDAPEGYLVETVDGWHHDDYVPFNRLNEVDKRVKGLGASGKIGQVRKGVIGLKGGLGKIPVLENMVKNVSFIISGTMRTIAMQETVKMALDVAIEKIEDAGIAPMIDPKTARAALASVEIPTEGMTDAELQRWQRMLSAVHPAASDTVVVYADGRPKHYRVLDPQLLRALKNIGPYQAKTWLNIIGFPKRLLQASITKMPAFLVKNLVREIQNAYIINEKNGLNPLKTLGSAVKNFGKLLKTDNPEMMAMMAGGFVNFNSYYNAAPADVRKRLVATGVNKSALRKVVESPWTATKNLWQLYMRVAVASEYANRLSVRQNYLDAGASEAEANYQALDVLNFSRRGDGLVMEILLATIPFLNPRIQGLDRLYRGTKQNWKAMAMKAGLMSASAIALSVWNWENNEEEMDKLKEEDKDLWYHFWVDGEHWRIPKGFEIGQIAGTLPERIVEQIRTDNPEPVWSSFKRFMMMTFGLQYPQIIAPALEIAQNRDFFRQRPIISFGQQFAPTKMQYDVWTSQVMIDLAQSMPDAAPEWARSPKKLEHLFKAYTASMGALVLEGANDLYRMTGNAPDAPTKALAQRYFIRDFYRSGVERSSRQINRFYSMTEEVGKLAVGLKAARENSMSEWRAMKIDNKEKLRIRSRLNKLSNKMRKQNIKIRKIMNSTTMDGDIKFIKIQEIQKRKNAIAVEATDKYWHIFEG